MNLILSWQEPIAAKPPFSNLDLSFHSNWRKNEKKKKEHISHFLFTFTQNTTNYTSKHHWNIHKHTTTKKISARHCVFPTTTAQNSGQCCSGSNIIRTTATTRQFVGNFSILSFLSYVIYTILQCIWILILVCICSHCVCARFFQLSVVILL